MIFSPVIFLRRLFVIHATSCRAGSAGSLTSTGASPHQRIRKSAGNAVTPVLSKAPQRETRQRAENAGPRFPIRPRSLLAHRGTGCGLSNINARNVSRSTKGDFSSARKQMTFASWNRRGRGSLSSAFLRYQNMLCRYDTYALKCQDIFSVHGFPVGLVQCENSLLGIPRVGSGSFRHFVEKYLRLNKYCLAPFETRTKGSRKEIVTIHGERIVDKFKKSFPRRGRRHADI